MIPYNRYKRGASSANTEDIEDTNSWTHIEGACGNAGVPDKESLHGYARRIEAGVDKLRSEQHENQGTKYDAGKTRWDLLPWDSIEKIAEIYTIGAEKYGENNWRTGFKWSRLIASTLRHFTAWIMGQDKDTESGKSHLAHVGWGALTLLHFTTHLPGLDDRIKVKSNGFKHDAE